MGLLADKFSFLSRTKHSITLCIITQMRFLEKIFNRKRNLEKDSKNRLSDKYLFETHKRTVITKWAKSLEFGYFKRGLGGRNDDGDEFCIRLSFNNWKELSEIITAFDITLNKIPKDFPKAVAGQEYSPAEFAKIKSKIKDFPNYEQPLNIKVKTYPCFCWIENGEIELNFSGALDANRYQVSEVDFENCKAIERIIKANGIYTYVKIDNHNGINQISRKLYPELFE
jgi:hypothetical protein